MYDTLTVSILLIIISGQFLVQHPTLPGATSKVISTLTSSVTFDLELIWSQATYDSPHQVWRATSNYNVKVSNGNQHKTNSFYSPKLIKTSYYSVTLPYFFSSFPNHRPIFFLFSLSPSSPQLHQNFIHVNTTKYCINFFLDIKVIVVL